MSFYIGRRVICGLSWSVISSSKRWGKEPSHSNFVEAGLNYFYEGEPTIANKLNPHVVLSESRTVYWATPNAERGRIVFSVPNFDLVSYVVGTSDPSIEVISLMKALHVLNSHWTTLYEVSKGRNMILVNCFFQDCLGGLFRQLAACVLRFNWNGVRNFIFFV